MTRSRWLWLLAVTIVAVTAAALYGARGLLQAWICMAVGVCAPRAKAREVPMKILLLTFVLVGFGCSTDTSPIAGSNHIPKGLFGQAGMGGTGIAQLDDAGRPVGDAGRPPIPTGSSDGGLAADDAGRDAAADAAESPDGGDPTPDAGAPPDAGPAGVGVCGTCSATEPCAPGLLCVDEAAAGLAPGAIGQKLGSRCYIDCASQAGVDTCTAAFTSSSCGHEWMSATVICPLQPHTFKVGC